jgi:hypothetical protein
MRLLRNRLNMVFGALVLAAAGTMIQAAPAAAKDATRQPACSVRYLSPDSIEAQCVQPSAVYSYRVTIYCMTDPSLPMYVVQSGWAPTSYTVGLNCYDGGFILTSTIDYLEAV